MAELGAPDLRYGIVALARTDRRLMDATLQSIARLPGAPDATVLAVSKVRTYIYSDAVSNPSSPRGLRIVPAESGDALPIADGFRAVAQRADIVVFVPEGIVLSPDYLASVREAAENWQDMVGEVALVHRTVEDDDLAPDIVASREQALSRFWAALRSRSLCASLFWLRVEACGNLRFNAFPQSAEYLAFSALLDQLRPRGRTRVISSDKAVQLRHAGERRSGFEAGRELYEALSRIGEWRERSDAAFAGEASYIDPRSEKRRLFGEQAMRYLGSSATRAHVGSFIKGMLAARREAAASRERIRSDLRKLR